MIPGVHEPEDGLLEVEGLPAGFLKISRYVLKKLANQADHYWNRNDRRSQVPIIFERTFEAGNRYGGDITFCRKWRALGGKVYAAYEMRLGHTAKSIIWDSLGAGLRRQTGTTLRHVVQRVRDGDTDPTMYSEARRFLANPFSATEDTIALAVAVARKANGPILEIGSGLTTILMAAAAPDHTVYCIEHDPGWAAQLNQLAQGSETFNIAICLQPINSDPPRDQPWYDLSDPEFADTIPMMFALALVDGPPRYLASRMPFYEHFGEDCETIVVDDMDDPGYREAVKGWAKAHDRKVDFIEERAALVRKLERKAA
jgi:hypothetical protein